MPTMLSRLIAAALLALMFTSNVFADDYPNRPVRLIVAYEASGTIRVYRDGQLYAREYRKTELQPFEKGQAQIVFGLRHGSGPTEGRMLTGRILEARLYDRALSEQEVHAATTGIAKKTVTEKMLVEALSPEQRLKLNQLDRPMESAEQLVRTIRQQIAIRKSQVFTQYRGCFGMAHALLNSREFVYVH